MFIEKPRLLKQASELAKLCKYEEALEAVGQFLKINPHDASAWADRAHIQLLTGNLESALQDITLAIGFCNDEPHFAHLKGRILFRSGLFEQAAAEFSRLIELCDLHDSDYYRTEAYFHRADSYIRLGQYDQALTDLEHVSDEHRGWTDKFRTKSSLLADCRFLK